MARFIVTHSLAQGTQDQLVEFARQVAASPETGAVWLNSWWVAEKEELLCEWEAPDMDAIQSSLEPAKEFLPIKSIHEVQWIDPQWYK